MRGSTPKRNARPRRRADASRRRWIACSRLAVAVAVFAATVGTGGAFSAAHAGAPGTRRSREPLARVAVAARTVPAVLPAVNNSGLLSFAPVVKLGSSTAVWLARVSASGIAGSSVTLLRFDQRVVRLQLHAGSLDPGGTWTYGPQVGVPEIHSLIAGFNGGFKLSYGAGGYEQEGKLVRPLLQGYGSIVTYSDGTTNIGSWSGEVPARGKTVVDVRQNLQLLIDGGRVASNVDSCVIDCWGATIGGRLVVARSGLGITAAGELVWAGGENLSVRALADALLGAGVVRAVELDINPDWVAGYIFQHASGTVAAIPMATGQLGINGQLIHGADTRDYFTVLAR
jgi:hypothetical protein